MNTCIILYLCMYVDWNNNNFNQTVIFFVHWKADWKGLQCTEHLTKKTFRRFYKNVLHFLFQQVDNVCFIKKKTFKSLYANNNSQA